ncbi:MAG TPA: hypothetical protein VHX38_11930 [Pseudonocardiaceae bacterium]|nr:hypothetical protein [Pseudonocardiaceae bacterium]
MVPDSFHDFFLGSTSIAGALVGLLFVAISVTPAAVTGKVEHIEQRIRAAGAMAAFLNALLVSLLALIPESNLSTGAVVLAVVSVASTFALLTVVVAQIISPTSRKVLSPLQWGRAVLWLTVLEGIYVWQLVCAGELTAGKVDTGVLKDLALITVLLFAIGVSRAWELVGARSPRVFTSVRGVAAEIHEYHERHEQERAIADLSPTQRPVPEQSPTE